MAGKAANARNYTQCDSLLLGDKCGAHTFPYVEVKNPTARVILGPHVSVQAPPNLSDEAQRVIGWLTLSDLSRHLLVESEVVQNALTQITKT